MSVTLLLGTRGSALARTQSGHVAESLMKARPGIEVRLEIVRTLGDAVQDRPLAQLGRTGVFTAELERALLDRQVDFAVHSLKDLPVAGGAGLDVTAIPAREDPRDALVVPSPATTDAESEEIASLPLEPGARVGTSSLRRRAQLLHARPDLRFFDLRGNVDTRLRKLDAGEFDACVFAAAGLRRLGLGHRAIRTMSPFLCTPDPGQGALAVQIRSDRDDLREILSVLDDPATRARVTAERTVLARLGGGCSTPIGALAVFSGGARMRLTATVAAPDGSSLIRAEAEGSADDPEDLGTRVAEQLIESGADRFVAVEKGRVPGAP